MCSEPELDGHTRVFRQARDGEQSEHLRESEGAFQGGARLPARLGRCVPLRVRHGSVLGSGPDLVSASRRSPLRIQISHLKSDRVQSCGKEGWAPSKIQISKDFGSGECVRSEERRREWEAEVSE